MLVISLRYALIGSRQRSYGGVTQLALAEPIDGMQMSDNSVTPPSQSEPVSQPTQAEVREADLRTAERLTDGLDAYKAANDQADRTRREIENGTNDHANRMSWSGLFGGGDDKKKKN